MLPSWNLQMMKPIISIFWQGKRRFNDYNVYPKNKNKPDAVELFSGIFYLHNIQLPEWNAPPDSNLAEKQQKKVINNILKDICQKWFEQSNLQNGHLPCLHQSDIPPMP